MTIEWGGGGTTAGITPRPIWHTENLRYYPLLCERIRRLAAAGYRTVKITACLAQEGFCSPQQDRVLNRQTVMELRQRLGVRQPNSPATPSAGSACVAVVGVSQRVGTLDHHAASVAQARVA